MLLMATGTFTAIGMAWPLPVLLLVTVPLLGGTVTLKGFSVVVELPVV